MITGLLFLLAAFLISIGMAGLALPALPGAPLLFLGLVVAGWAEDFQYLPGEALFVLGLLASLTYAVDIVAGALGAKRFGASKRAMAGATLGAFAGIFFGLWGIALGPFAGAVVGELSHARKLRAAGRSGMGATIGMLVGAVAKLAIAFSMLGLFFFLRFAG